MRKIIFTLLLLAFPCLLFAQIDLYVNPNLNFANNNAINSMAFESLFFNNNVRTMAEASIRSGDFFEENGSTERFLCKGWTKGEVISNKNQKISTDKYQYNYDLMMHELYAKRGDTAIIVNPEQVRWFDITDKNTKHTFGKFPAIGSAGFEELLSTDTATNKLKLIKHCTISKKNTSENSGTALTGQLGEEYQRDVSYYLIDADNNAIKLKLNKSEILAGLPQAYQARANILLTKYKKLDEPRLAMLINELNSN